MHLNFITKCVGNSFRVLVTDQIMSLVSSYKYKMLWFDTFMSLYSADINLKTAQFTFRQNKSVVDL